MTFTLGRNLTIVPLSGIRGRMVGKRRYMILKPKKTLL
jgi:hypothetical protein